jgi:CHAD domain-containing protein
MAYRLSFEQDMPTATRAAAREQLDEAVAQLRESSGQEPADALRGARTNLRQSRALLRLVRSDLDQGMYRRENRALRDAGRDVSDVRDADAMVETVDKLRDRFIGFIAGVAFDELRHRLVGDADKKRKQHRDHSMARLVDTLRDAAARIDDWPLESVDWRTVERGIARAYKRGRKAFRKAVAKPTVRNLRRLRKRTKDLLYDERLLAAAWPVVLGAAAQESQALSDLLGDDLDLAVLADRLRELDDPPAQLDELIDLIGRRRGELFDELERLGRRIYAEAPNAFAKRLRRYLEEAARMPAVAGAAHR